jgi:predicted nucleic acid-binding protein
MLYEEEEEEDESDILEELKSALEASQLNTNASESEKGYIDVDDFSALLLEKKWLDQEEIDSVEQTLHGATTTRADVSELIRILESKERNLLDRIADAFQEVSSEEQQEQLLSDNEITSTQETATEEPRTYC